MPATTSILDGLRIASPCPVSWEGMDGDERTRFCSHCRTPVFNLSNLSRAEAEELIREKNGKLCARYYQRPDGGVMLRDCPGVPSVLRRGLVVMLGFLLLLLIGVALSLSGDGSRSRLFNYQPFRTIQEWLGPQQVVQGEICLPPLPGAIPAGPPQERAPD